MSAKKSGGFKKIYAILILLAITLGASGAAYFWLTSVEEHIEYGDKLIISEIDYDAETQDITVYLINGLATSIPIKSTGGAREKTVVTIYPYGVPTAMPDCTWVDLTELACAGTCDTDLAPNAEAELTFEGKRAKCQLDPETQGELYHLELFFGTERVEQNFKI